MRRPVYTYLKKGPWAMDMQRVLHVEWIGHPTGIRPDEHIISHEPLFWPRGWRSLSVPSGINVPSDVTHQLEETMPPVPHHAMLAVRVRCLETQMVVYFATPGGAIGGELASNNIA